MILEIINTIQKRIVVNLHIFIVKSMELTHFLFPSYLLLTYIKFAH